MAFKVEVTAEAELDLEAVLDRLVDAGVGEAGLRWFRGMREALNSLAQFPERCEIAPESRELGLEVRHLIYGKRSRAYRILFTIQGDRVLILHVRHGRRQPLAS